MKSTSYEVLYSVIFSVLISCVPCSVRICFVTFSSIFKELSNDRRTSKEKKSLVLKFIPFNVTLYSGLWKQLGWGPTVRRKKSYLFLYIRMLLNIIYIYSLFGFLPRFVFEMTRIECRVYCRPTRKKKN